MRFKLLYNQQVLKESINDKNLFKAVILAGGPGSGKSFIVDKMFSGTGVKVINSDDFFEHLLVKNDVPMKIDPDQIEQYKKQMELRTKAKNLTSSKLGNIINGMLPIIIDGTGREFKKISSQKNALESIGYDVSMVFVNTSLDIALDRNKKRQRSVPEDIVVRSWNDIQKNIGKFQNIFKNNLIIVDNNNVLEGDKLKKLELDLAKKSMKLLNSKLKNHIGIKSIDILKSIGGKYLFDLPNYQNVNVDI